MSFLEEMVATTRARVANWPRIQPNEVGARPSFRAALRPAAQSRSAVPVVVAEVKRRSPSAGDLAPGLSAVEQARRYVRGGAAAISVLTEPSRFGGSMEDLRSVCAAVDRPVLMKDFVLDECQIDAAAVLGASAVLLIVRLLDDSRLRALMGHAHGRGLDVLVECHDAGEVDRALYCGARFVGVNNRDLDTLDVDRGRARGLLPRVPEHCLAVAESGYDDPAQVRALGGLCDAVLIGSSLVRAESDPEAFLREAAR